MENKKLINRNEEQYRDFTLADPGKEEDRPEGVISGVAVVFNSPTELYPGVFEKISDKAVDNALLRGDDVRFLFNHNADFVIARLSAGGLRLWKEADGLHFEAKIDPEIGWQKDLWRQVAAGVINNCSFGFRIDKESWEELEDGSELYTVEDVRLYDISLVTFPAYEDTAAEARDKTRTEKAAEGAGEDPEIDYINAVIGAL